MRPLERIAAQVDRWLDNLARIERETMTQDDMGAHRHEWQLLADDVACRLISGKDSRTPQTEMVGAQPKLTEQYRVVLPLGTDVLGGDRIIIGGVAYRVVSLSNMTGVYVMAVVTT
jgi:hypothetical protein